MLTSPRRQNPAVTANPGKAFIAVVQALEAETLQGKIGSAVVQAVKALVQSSGTNLAQIEGALAPEQQRAVQVYFG
jgi:hypothetical protein